MFRKKAKDPNLKALRKKLRPRKIVMWFIWLLVFAVTTFLTMMYYFDTFDRLVDPQISRAIIQVSQLLPQLESSEEAVRAVHDALDASRVTLLGAGLEMEGDYDDEKLNDMVSKSLSWIDRITKLKVGHNGFVVVASKEDGKILSHPDPQMIGKRIMVMPYLKSGILSFEYMQPDMNLADIDIEQIDRYMTADGLQISHQIVVIPEDSSPTGIGLGISQVSVVSFKDTYIICGVQILEVLNYLLPAMLICIITAVILWVFLRYINMLLDTRNKEMKALSSKVLALSIIVTVLIMITSWYVQILSNITRDLKTMEKHAQVAVETLDTYRKMRDNINEWLDEQYLLQCRIVSEFIVAYGRDLLTRDHMQMLADAIGAKYIYAFDKNGKVIITNSPYDHLSLSTDPADNSYAFRRLLEGVDHVIQPPVHDEAYDEYIQYIGVSTRSEDDLCNGFVQIAIDPELRDWLIEPLNTETVLFNLVTGLPKYAVAIDKETHSISSTTGIGNVGDSMETIGIKADKIDNNVSGFLRINGTTYYAGFSESSDLYLVPIVPQSGTYETLMLSLLISGISFVMLIIVQAIAFRRYVEIVEATEPKEDPEENKEKEKPVDDMEDDDMGGIFAQLIKAQDKWDFEERWHIKIPKDKQTPGTRIKTIVYRILLIICVVCMLPVLSYYMSGNSTSDNLGGIAYVIIGNWERGFNIFALTSCVFLLCVLYVFIVLADRILYNISRISSMRVETVCLLIRSSLKYICAIIFIYYGLSQFGIDTQTLLASAGILSLIIGLGAKDLVNDIIAGFFIIFEGTFKVGDFVTIGSWYGTVTQIGLRTTKISYYSDTKIYNNSTIREIINADGDVARVVLKFPVSYGTDLKKLEDILEKELPLMEPNIPGILQPLKYQGVNSFEENGIMLRIAIYTVPYKRYRARRELMREIKLLFERYGIEMPYRMIALHNGDPGDIKAEDIAIDVSEMDALDGDSSGSDSGKR